MPTDSDSRKLERIESALSNLEISADSVNLNTDGLEAKLDTANGILTTLSADTALLKADVADGVGVTGTFWPTTQPISGTVTIGGFSTVSIGSSGEILAGGMRGSGVAPIPLDVSDGRVQARAGVQYTSGGAFVDVSSSNPLPVTGTVTVAGSITALPGQGDLNDYSGSITTANTSYNVANRNTSRRYALVQNISDTGMWLGIGTAATTTSGIFLASNSGIVWESGYIPTPTLSILCTTSGKRFVVKEI